MSAAPAARVGMVGAGQLARMSQQAAIALDVELVLLARDAEEAGARAVPSVEHGEPEDPEALHRLATRVDVVTFDHELAPNEELVALEAEGFALRPSAAAKRFAQDKLHARRRFAELGFPIPAFEPIEAGADLEAIGRALGWPLVVKARSGGYDGRGVELVDDAAAAAEAISRGEWFAEERVLLERELAQIVARSPSGEVAAYPLIETVQRDGICVETMAPARVAEPVARSARQLGEELVEAIGAVGVVAIELFLDRDGRLLVNELALRPHNSGHLTIEGCETSQFENHLRAVLDWPLGATELRAPAVAMSNVLGAGIPIAEGIAGALGSGMVHLHLYGKRADPGRKVGHVTALDDEIEPALERARHAAALLTGGGEEGSSA